jgi:signal transduction histidine kinase
MTSETSTISADQSVEDLRRELAEAREQQSATAEILRVISSSPMDLPRVFSEMATSAARLCNANDAQIRQVDGTTLRLVAQHGSIPSYPELKATRGLVSGRAVLERRTIQVTDLDAEPDEYPEGSAHARRLGYRTLLAVPLIRAGAATGVINIRRMEARPFSDKQIALLETFANQAVIAIENTRLFEEVQARTREITEALEQQTATSDVLAVIASSPGELEPVFQSLLANAVRICEASFGAMWLREGDSFRNVTFHGALSPVYADQWRGSVIRPDSDLPVARAARSKKTIHIEDLRADPTYLGGKPLTVSAVDTGGIRTMLVVPMFKEDEFIGAMAIYRLEVRPFSDKQIELIKSFATQAVIAIENTRLLNELRESLQQQTATADVLKVISRSALDVQKVLDALVESAARLCNAYDASIFQVFGDGLRLVANQGQIPSSGPVGQLTIPLVRGRIPGRAVIDRRTIHVVDVVAEGDEYPESHKNALQQGYRTVLAVPLAHAGEAIGVIALRRSEVRPFTERQIELLQTFADQAVIAIENTRLFGEVQARTQELAKTVEDLEIASQHKNQFVANMSHELRTPLAAILGYAELMREGFYEPQGPKSLDALTRIRSNGRHLLGLINTVLDIAKIESGQFTLNMAEYAIESVVETVRSATESLAQNKKLALKTEVAKSLPIGLGDEQRLTQVLLNLVGNAIKFTDAGEVRVTAKAVNGRFNVSVTDTGPGIPVEHQARIFDQFHQVDSSNTKAKSGTGLGLAIAKQIVEMHGGRIWVESTLGNGSIFQMELPTRAELRKLAS